MTPVLALPTRTSSRRWPLDAFAVAVGIAGDADLAHAVRVPLVVVVRARRRGLDLGQAEAWCRKIRIAPTAVWPDFTADDPSDAAADDSDGDVEPGVRYCLDPVLADLPHDFTVSEVARALGVPRHRIYAWIDRGLAAATADVVACRRGVHPSFFWPEWGAA